MAQEAKEGKVVMDDAENGKILLSLIGFKEVLKALNMKLSYEDMCRFAMGSTGVHSPTRA